MVGAEREGDVVLAQARIVELITEPKRCPPPDPCRDAAMLADVSGSSSVAVGWRPAPEGTGTRVEDENGVRWLTRVGVPTNSSLFAFRILTDAVEYLGPVVETADGETGWNVSDVKAGEHPDLAGDLYAVDGWLVQTPPVPCPPPNNSGPDTTMAYWCGGSFITSARVETYSPEHGVLLDPGGLHVQGSAYEEFAPTPVTDAQRGGEPRLGTYLVRSAGCHPVTAGDCPVWSMVGRLDDFTPPGQPSPPPANATPAPPIADLRWSVEPFLPEIGAQPGAIAEVGGRLIITGRDEDGPAAWYSDDDGATWSRASIRDDGDRRRRALGSVAGTSDLLLSLGWVYLGGGNDADRRSVLWASTDMGATWEQIQGDSVPPRIHDLIAGGPGFVAVGNANPSNSGLPDLEPPHSAVWLSTNGQDWEQLPDEESFQLSRIEAIAELGGQLVAVGSHGVDEEVRPAVWTSSDGRTWSRIDISASFGAVDAIAAGPNGFVAVGISGTGGWSAAAWLSPDGTTWTPQLLDETAGTTAGVVAVNQAGFVAIGRSTQTTEIYGSAWFVPIGGAPSPQTINAAVHDLVATGGGFAGVGRFCGPTADCPDISMLVIGRPVGAAGPEPSPSVTTHLVGTLHGDADLEVGCAWLTDATGKQWEVLWPAGYRIGFPAGRDPVLTGPDGDIVARAGDIVALMGGPPSGLGSHCMVGQLFEATAVVDVQATTT